MQHMILPACSLMQDPLIRISPIVMSVLRIICEACSPISNAESFNRTSPTGCLLCQNMVLMFSGAASFNHNLCLWGGKVPASVYLRQLCRRHVHMSPISRQHCINKTHRKSSCRRGRRRRSAMALQLRQHRQAPRRHRRPPRQHRRLPVGECQRNCSMQ